MTAATSPFRLLSLDRLPRDMTPNHMKYPSVCCKLPLGIFEAGNVGSFITGLPGGCTWLYCVMMQEDTSTNLVFFRLPSSESVLVEPLFFESQDLTPSTRSSTSESVSASSPLGRNKNQPEFGKVIGEADTTQIFTRPSHFTSINKSTHLENFPQRLDTIKIPLSRVSYYNSKSIRKDFQIRNDLLENIVCSVTAVARATWFIFTSRKLLVCLC